MKRTNITICLLFIVVLSGCGEIILNINENYKISSCPVTVIDMRPDQRLISGLEGNLFSISPSVKEFLYAKLCNNEKINKTSQNNNIVIRIRDLKYHGIVHYFSGERIIIIDGSLEYNGKYYEIQTNGKRESTGETIKVVIPIIFNEAADKFVDSVASYIK